MSQTKSLFSEFNPVSSKEWKQQIQMELKGVDYTNTLVWQSIEGIAVKPFYHTEDNEYLDIPILKKDYQICQTIFVDDPAVANEIALDMLSKGVGAIQFISHKSFDIDVLLQGFKTLKNKPNFYFKLQFLSTKFLSDILDYSDAEPLIIQQDIIGHLAQTGNWFVDERDDFKTLNNLVKKHPNKSILEVDASIYQNAGATIVQQIAYALSHANEYLNVFGDTIKSEIQFEFAIAGNYFFEIAKLRAFRYLWRQLTAEYAKEIPVKIIAKPSSRNKTLYDYNVNMLRTSTEYMSAVLGGADVITTRAYDYLFKKSNSFSNRIARNQLLVLREENSFEDAQSFVKGSYYIETLSLELAKKSLNLFKELEKSGGFLANLKTGLIQRKIREVAQKEQDLFDAGKISLLGTNRYPNPDDKMKTDLELYPFLKTNKKQTIIQPIISKRLTEKIEKERLSKE